MPPLTIAIQQFIGDLVSSKPEPRLALLVPSFYDYEKLRYVMRGRVTPPVTIYLQSCYIHLSSSKSTNMHNLRVLNIPLQNKIVLTNYGCRRVFAGCYTQFCVRMHIIWFHVQVANALPSLATYPTIDASTHLSWQFQVKLMPAYNPPVQSTVTLEQRVRRDVRKQLMCSFPTYLTPKSSTVLSVCPEQNHGPLDGHQSLKNDAHKKSVHTTL